MTERQPGEPVSVPPGSGESPGAPTSGQPTSGPAFNKPASGQPAASPDDYSPPTTPLGPRPPQFAPAGRPEQRAPGFGPPAGQIPMPGQGPAQGPGPGHGPHRPPIGPPPGVPLQTSGPGVVRPAAERNQPNLLGIISLGLVVILLVVAVIQTLFVVRLSSRANEQADALRTTNSQLEEARQQLDDLNKRATSLEERTEGTLNSSAIAAKVLPSVFRVRAGRAIGTAFAIGQPDSGGGTLLLTNYHVVEEVIASGGQEATIERGESESFRVEIVGGDERRDIAVLRSDQAFPRLAPAKEDVQPGDQIIVVGSPLGLSDTVTTGVVSTIRDGIAGLNTRVIQFSAAINPGNSGGPVIDAEGLVVGIAQAKITEDDADGLALAIPIDEACKDLIKC